jgi:selenide,water dikinase
MHVYLVQIKHLASLESAGAAYDTACESMGRLNAKAAALMHKHGAHAATDVTGFGILGHTRYASVCICITVTYGHEYEA